MSYGHYCVNRTYCLLLLKPAVVADVQAQRLIIDCGLKFCHQRVYLYSAVHLFSWTSPLLQLRRFFGQT